VLAACLGLACHDALAPLPADTTEPFVVTLLDGGGQSVAAGEWLPRAVRVRVTTERGRRLRDVRLITTFSGCWILVTCSSPPDTASFALIEGDSVRTGSDGTATFRLRGPAVWRRSPGHSRRRLRSTSAPPPSRISRRPMPTAT